MQPASVTPGDASIPVDADKIFCGSRLLGAMRDLIRRKHYSLRTEQAYLQCATKRFILFHGKRYPNEMGETETVAFRRDLVVACNVAASTQNQALNSLVFLYKKVLGREDLEQRDLTPFPGSIPPWCAGSAW